MKLSNLYDEDSNTTSALKAVGLDNSTKLLDATRALEDPSELAELLDIDEQTFSSLVGRSELLSIRGVGKAYVDLLATVGITTKEQLSTSDPFKLHELIKQVVQHTDIGRVPNRATIEGWIEQALE